MIPGIENLPMNLIGYFKYRIQAFQKEGYQSRHLFPSKMILVPSLMVPTIDIEVLLHLITITNPVDCYVLITLYICPTNES